MCLICDSTFTFSSRQRIQLNKDLGVDGVVDAAINQLYDDRTIDKPTKKALFESHYEPLKQAVNEGFGKIEYNSPNYEFLKQLQTNTAVFAIFKSHAQMKEMAALLKDKEGNLRSKQDFKTEALKIDSTYRTTHLDTEYDTAVRTARLAAQWQKILKNKRLYPNLKYLLTKSSKPDEKHLRYVGIIAPVDSIFWSTHYPPNRWRCQCGVEQTDEDTSDIPHDLPPVDPEFAFNAGKIGQVFDINKSGYIKSVPKEQPSLIREAGKLVNKQAAIDAPYQSIYKSKKEGNLSAHPLAFDSSDFNENVAEGRNLANQLGKNIKILPVTNDPDLRKVLIPSDAKGNHCPDFTIEGIGTIELKTLKQLNENSLDSALKRAYKQCNQIAISLPDDSNIDFLKQRLKGQFKDNFSKMETVMLKIKGKWQLTTKDKIRAGDWDF